MIIAFPFSLNTGFSSSGGEMIISVLEDFREINSLNVIWISGDEKWIELFLGSHATTSGGEMSLAPPTGVTGLAQRNINTENRRRNREVENNLVRKGYGVGFTTSQSYQSFSKEEKKFTNFTQRILKSSFP